jgi:hypothetical protein
MEDMGLMLRRYEADVHKNRGAAQARSQQVAFHAVRILVILAALVFVPVFLVVSHIVVTPESALLVSLVLGTIGGVTDYPIRRRS